jgi:PIN domain nuclease of toxin-antitoxin system
VTLLLDTHVLYWSFYEESRLSKRALRLLDEADDIYVSSASLWELSIKFRIGKFKADPKELAENLEEAGMLELPVRMRHALQVAKLPRTRTDSTACS